MKICYYNHTGKVSGAEKVLFTLLANVGPEFETSLVSPDTAPIRAFCQKHGIHHLPVDELRARFTMNPFRLVRYIFSGIKGISQIGRRIRAVGPDVVHANSTRAGMVACLGMLGSKTQLVWHVHDQFRKHPITNAVRVVLGSSRKNSVIAVSQATALAVRGGARRGVVERVPIAVIHNGVDGAMYPPQAGEVEKFLKTEGLAEATFLVAMIGQITPRKGQLETIETFARLVGSDAPGAQLLIVGNPVFNNDELYLQSLVAKVKELGIEANVKFMGHRTDIPVILQSCHLLISNSSSEPFSLVLLEACASATPILASAVDGVPELIIDGVTGRLFPKGDSGAMLSALRQLSRDRAYSKSLGMAARERVLSHFTQEGFLQKVRQHYMNVASYDRASRLLHTVEGCGQAPSWDAHDA
jgi:glycosyltransferase involved in cell wall biosynthesis